MEWNNEIVSFNKISAKFIYYNVNRLIIFLVH